MGRADDRTLAAIAEANHGVFTRAHARSVGLSSQEIRHRLDTGQWRPLHEVVYRLAGTPMTWKSLLLAACWAGGFRAVASHRSAASLWGFAGGRRGVAEITCPRWRRAQHDGLVVHESKALAHGDLTPCGGIPTTTPDRTLLDLGAVRQPSIVEMAFDGALNRGLTTVSSVRRTLDRLGKQGRNGAGVLREILERHYGRPAVPESEMETMLFQALRRAGIPTPVPQHDVMFGGEFVARVDAAYPALRIAIEYDSVEHHSGRDKLLADTDRRNRLWAIDWLPVTATVTDLKDGGRKICAAINGARRRAA